jgi:hypothetical protein
MKTIRKFLRTNAITLAWAAAIILHVTLFSYATERVGLVQSNQDKTSLASMKNYGEVAKPLLANDLPKPVLGSILTRLNGVAPWDWANSAAVLAVFLLGSALWQAMARMREENKHLFPAAESVYSWRNDSLLLTFAVLLLSIIGLTAIISFTPISAYTFWIGYAGVSLSQLTPAGRRVSERLLYGFESVFKSTDRAIG